MRAFCIVYMVLLTLLLLTADPTRVIGVHGRLPWLLQALAPYAHALGFLVLAVLALRTRWPTPRWGIVLILVLYGGMTEIAQGFLPPRTADWMDWLHDLAGIAVGAALCWAVALLAGALARSARSRDRVSSIPSDDWEVLRKVMSRPAATDEQSWWS